MRIHRGTHTLVALLALMPVMALASNPWDGTWQIKPESYKISGKPDVYELIKGLYTCGVCNPPYTVKADGSDQHVAGNGY